MSSSPPSSSPPPSPPPHVDYTASIVDSEPVYGLHTTPTHAVVDDDGNLFVSDPASHVILRLPLGDNKFEVYIGCRGFQGSTNGHRLEEARLNRPRGLEALRMNETFPAASLLILDGSLRVESQNIVFTLIDEATSTDGPGMDGSCVETSGHKTGSLRNPMSVKFAPSDPKKLFILEESGAIRVFDTLSNLVTTLKITFDPESVLFRSSTDLYLAKKTSKTIADEETSTSTTKMVTTTYRIDPERNEIVKAKLGESRKNLRSSGGENLEKSNPFADFISPSSQSISDAQDVSDMVLVPSHPDFLVFGQVNALAGSYLSSPNANERIYLEQNHFEGGPSSPLSSIIAFVPQSNAFIYKASLGKYSIKRGLLWPHPLPGARPPLVDFSLVINCPHYTFNCDLVHDLSGTTWNVPSQLLGPSLNNVAQVVQETKLPASSIFAFLEYLCHKPLSEDLEPRKKAISLAHTIHLLKESQVNPRLALSDLITKVIPLLSYEEVCHSLIDIWLDDRLDNDLNDTTIHAFAKEVRKGTIDDFAQVIDSRLQPGLVKLCMHVWNFKVNLEHIDQLSRSRLRMPIHPEHEKYSREKLFQLAQSSDKESFWFALEETAGEFTVVKASMMFMIPQWRWIRRLFDSDGSESKDRLAIMPSDWMSLKMLIDILQCIHSGTFSPTYEIEDALHLLEHAIEFDLVEEDGSALTPFKDLIDHTEEVCFPPLTKENALDLLLRAHRLKRKARFESLMDYVMESLASYQTSELLKKLSREIILDIQERVQKQP